MYIWRAGNGPPGLPHLLPTFCLWSTPAAFWESTPHLLCKTSASKSPKLSENYISLATATGSAWDSWKDFWPSGRKAGKAAGVAAATLHQNRKGYLAPDGATMEEGQPSDLADVVLLLILTLVWVTGANKTSLLSATQRVFGLPCEGKAACKVGDLGSIPGLGRSSEEGNSYPLEYSGLENFMGCIDHGIAKSRTWLSDLHLHFHFTKESLEINVTTEWALPRHSAGPPRTHTPPLTPPRGAICRIAHRAPSNAQSSLCAPLLQFLG